MNFQIVPLPIEPVTAFFALHDEQLRARGAKRYVADRQPGFPCRVSLMDATPGERVVLVPFTYQDSDSPYRASGPIFIRENAQSASVGVNDVPGLVRLRVLSVRAYDADALMIDADVVDLIRFRGHLPKGGYDVQTDGRHPQAPAAPAIR